MSNLFDYVTEQTLLDVTFSSMAAGATIQSPTSGTKTVGASTVLVTANTITSTALPKTLVADALHVYCIPPITAAGAAVDFEFWFGVDDQDMHNFQIFDAHADRLMTPWAMNIVGGGTDGIGKPRGFSLGRSARAVLWDAANGKGTPNMALQMTGIKYKSSLTVYGASIAGFAAPLVPARVIVTGELLPRELVDRFGAFYDGTIYLQHLQREIMGKPALAIAGTRGVTFDTFTGLPGGVDQKANKIHRFARWGTHAVATGAQAAFPLSNLSDLQGGQTNVGPAAANADSRHDLGFNTPKTSDAFWLRGFGVRIDPTAATAGNVAYAGWQVDGDVFPSQNGNTGHILRTLVNPFQYGSVQPQRPETNLFLEIPRYPGELLINGEAAVPVIAANGVAIAAGVVTVAIDGVIVKRSA